MNRDIGKGKWRQFVGRIRQAFGGATGDRGEQAKGGLQELGGKIQTGVGKLEDDSKRKPPAY